MENLPTIAELHSEIEVAKQSDKLNTLLNQPPPTKWVKEHPFAKGVKYLPVDKVESMLTKIFQQWKIEVIGYNQLFNSVACHVRLHYLNPVTNQWQFQDGLGAVGVQVDKGEQASNLNAIKQNAIMLALPAAKSYALKDAAEHLGILFGRDLNRKDTVAFTASIENTDEQLTQLKQLFELKEDNLTPEEQINIKRIIDAKEIKSYRKAINFLKTK